MQETIQQPELEVAIPPAVASENGRENFYFHLCEKQGHCRAYAACLSLLDKVNEGVTLNAGYASCVSAINAKSCPALAMREKERLEGRAIYFKPRAVPLEVIPVHEEVFFPEPAPRAETVLPISSGSYADALNSYLDSINPRAVSSADQLEQ